MKDDKKKRKILLVDDNYDTVEALFDRLSFEGYDVIVAYDGQECLEKLKHDNPELIVMDLMMPKLDGFETISRIRAENSYNHIPIIVSSAKDAILDIKRVEQLGISAYAAKPYKASDLMNKIELCLSGQLDEQEALRDAKIKSFKKAFK